MVQLLLSRGALSSLLHVGLSRRFRTAPLCFSLSKLNARELSVIDDVLNKLTDMNASQLSEYSHKDVPPGRLQKGEMLLIMSRYFTGHHLIQ